MKKGYIGRKAGVPIQDQLNWKKDNYSDKKQLKNAKMNITL